MFSRWIPISVMIWTQNVQADVLLDLMNGFNQGIEPISTCEQQTEPEISEDSIDFTYKNKWQNIEVEVDPYEEETPF